MIHTAKLISITPDAEKTIAHCARVSSPHQTNEKIEGLLKYCATHGHWSVFEMATMVVEITTTRAISPQILRHRSFNFQEFSQRYSDPSQVSETPLPSLIQSIQRMEFRLQDTKNRQNSIEVDQQDFTKFKTRALFLAKVSNKLYQDMLVSGIAKEVARGILPLNTPTRLYMSGTIRSWIHYIGIRSGEATQKEHRLIAESIKTLFKRELPTIGKAVGF